MTGSYSRSEVIWLLSLTRSDAIYLDEGFRDSCLCLVAAHEGTALSADGPQVPVIARWNDVHRARVDGKQAVAVLALRAGGFSERELARLSDHSRRAVRQQWTPTVDEIIARLAGDEMARALSHVDLCLSCGERPRIRLYRPERLASVCVDCLAPELSRRVARCEPEPDAPELGLAA